MADRRRGLTRRIHGLDRPDAKGLGSYREWQARQEEEEKPRYLVDVPTPSVSPVMTEPTPTPPATPEELAQFEDEERLGVPERVSKLKPADWPKITNTEHWKNLPKLILQSLGPARYETTGQPMPLPEADKMARDYKKAARDHFWHNVIKLDEKYRSIEDPEQQDAIYAKFHELSPEAKPEVVRAMRTGTKVQKPVRVGALVREAAKGAATELVTALPKLAAGTTRFLSETLEAAELPVSGVALENLQTIGKWGEDTYRQVEKLPAAFDMKATGENWYENMAYNLGSGTVTLGEAALATATTGNPWAASILFGLRQNSEIYMDARSKGVEPLEALRASLPGGVREGSLEFAGVHFLFKKFSGRMTKILVNTLTEAGQEWSQETGGNLVKMLYDPEARTWDAAFKGSVEAALLGGILGGGAGLAVDIHLDRQADIAVRAAGLDPKSPEGIRLKEILVEKLGSSIAALNRIIKDETGAARVGPGEEVAPEEELPAEPAEPAIPAEEIPVTPEVAPGAIAPIQPPAEGAIVEPTPTAEAGTPTVEAEPLGVVEAKDVEDAYEVIRAAMRNPSDPTSRFNVMALKVNEALPDDLRKLARAISTQLERINAGREALPAPGVEAGEGTAEFLGYQEHPTKPSFPLYNVTSGPQKGTTVSAESLEKMGIAVPETPAAPAEEAEKPLTPAEEAALTGKVPPKVKGPRVMELLKEEFAKFEEPKPKPKKPEPEMIKKGLAMKAAETARKRGLTAGARAQAQRTKELSLYAKEHLPAAEIAKLQPMLDVARTPAKIKEARRRIETAAEKYDRRKAMIEFHEKKPKPKELKELRPEFRKRAERLLTAINDRNTGSKILQHMESLLRHVEFAGDPEVPEVEIEQARTTLARAAQTPLWKMPPSSIRAVTAALLRIKHISATKNKLFFWRKGKSEMKMVRQSTADVEARFPVRRGLDPGMIEERKLQKGITRLLTKAQVSLQTHAETIGGRESPMYDVLVDSIQRARWDTHRVERQADEVVEKVIKKHSLPIGWDVQARALDLPDAGKIALQRGEIMDIRNTWTRNKTKWELLREDHKGITFRREAVGKARKWTRADYESVIEQMTEEELDMAKAMKEYLNTTLKDQINKIWMVIRGREIASETDYWNRSRDADYRNVEPDVAMRKWQERQLHDMGIFKALRKSDAPFAIENAMDRYNYHTKMASMFVGKELAVHDAMKLLRNTDFRHAVQARLKWGHQALQDMEAAIVSFRGLEHVPKGGFERISKWFLKNFQRGALSAKVHIPLYQWVSYMGVLTEMDAKHWKAGFKKAPAGTDKEMIDNNPDLWSRSRSSAHSIISPLFAGQEEGAKHYWGPKAESKLDKLLKPIHGMDWIVMRRIWLAAKAEGSDMGLSGQKLIDHTAKRSTEIIDATQPTWDVSTISALALEGRKNLFVKQLVTMFTSQTSKNLQMMVRAVSTYQHGEKTGKDALRMIKNVAIPSILQSIMIQLIYDVTKWGMNLFRKERRPEGAKFALAVFERLFGNWMIARDLIGLSSRATQAALAGKPRGFVYERKSPIASVTEDATDVAYNIVTAIKHLYTQEEYQAGDKKWEKKWKTTTPKMIETVVQTAGMIFGWPTGGISQIARGLMPRKSDEKKREAAAEEAEETSGDLLRSLAKNL